MDFCSFSLDVGLTAASVCEVTLGSAKVSPANHRPRSPALFLLRGGDVTTALYLLSPSFFQKDEKAAEVAEREKKRGES